MTDAKKPPAYFQCERKEMLKYVPVGARSVLEVGCGAGLFGERLIATRGVSVVGIELDDSAAAEAEGRLTRVIRGRYPEATKGLGLQFDCIIFNDVLEHLENPWMALTAAGGLLAAGGRVVASIPNVRYLPHLYKLVIRGEWKYGTSGLLDRDHLRFFTRKSVSDLFGEAGYIIERLEGIHYDTHWQAAIVRYGMPWLWSEFGPLEFAVVARRAGSAGTPGAPILTEGEGGNDSP